MDVVTFDDHVAGIDANAEFDPPVIWLIGVAVRHTLLDFDGAVDSTDDA